MYAVLLWPNYTYSFTAMFIAQLEQYFILLFMKFWQNMCLLNAFEHLGHIDLLHLIFIWYTLCIDPDCSCFLECCL